MPPVRHRFLVEPPKSASVTASTAARAGRLLRLIRIDSLARRASEGHRTKPLRLQVDTQYHPTRRIASLARRASVQLGEHALRAPTFYSALGIPHSEFSLLTRDNARGKPRG